MRTVDVVVAAVWIVFWVSWVAASLATKATRSRSSSGAAVRVTIIVAIFVLVRARVLRGAGTTIDDPVLVGLGVALFALGLGLAVWARVRLGRNWGTPMSEKDDPELVTAGPYRFVRHPIYSGIILGMVGTALAVSLYWLVVAALAGGYFVYSATVEERIMARNFPDSYLEYKRSTKMLVPFLF